MSQLCPNIDSNICRSCEFRETCNVNAANQTATWGSINGDIQLQKDLQGVLSVLRAYVDAAISTLRDELLGKDTITKNMLRAEFRTLLDDNSVSISKRFVALESGLQKQIVDLRDIDIAGMREMVIPVRDGFVTLNKDIGTMLDNRIVVAKTDMTKEFDAKFDAKETVLRGSIDDITADMATYKSGLDAVKSRVGTLENAGYQTAAQVQTAMSTKLADYALNSTVASMQNQIDSAVITIHRGIWSADAVDYKAGNTVVYAMYPMGSMLSQAHIYRCIAAHTSSQNDILNLGSGNMRTRTLDPNKWEDCGVYIETTEA